MKLSVKTKAILENFASINNSLLVLQGTKQKTVNLTKTLLADAELEEDFPTEFGIYDLNKFLSVVSLFKDPELSFGSNAVTFKEGSNEATFTYCEPKLIKSPPKGKDMSIGTVVVSFTLTPEILGKLLKAARIFSHNSLIVEGDGANITLTVKDTKNTSSDTFREVLGDTTETFQYSFDIESLKFISGNYDVQIDDRKIGKFSCKEMDLVYWVPSQKV